MRLDELEAVAQRITQYDYITRARRIQNNTIEISFGKEVCYLFDMTRGHSTIYKAPSQRPMQGFGAPFDVLLHSLVSASRLLNVQTLEGDRVLRFELQPKSNYKEHSVVLQLEFTGKNTNAILIDDSGVTIEALRHIDSGSSFRVVRPGVELLDIPPRNSRDNDSETIDDIDTLLEDRYAKAIEQRLVETKRVKLTSIDKKIKKLKQSLSKIGDEQKLKAQSLRDSQIANIVLANLYQIKPYDTKLETYDFDGNPITVKLPKNIVKNRISDYYFNLSKRANNKASKVHIERSNLTSKISFYENIRYAIEQTKSIQEIELLLPKRANAQKRKDKLRDGELFWIEDHKVIVGRNSNENQKILKLAKANDIWMHIQGIPSSHVIIRTDKQNLPQNVIEAAAKLCVDFSTQNPGDYLVDYTKRKFVKVQEGSNVLYNKYDTISVVKEGVEIRE